MAAVKIGKVTPKEAPQEAVGNMNLSEATVEAQAACRVAAEAKVNQIECYVEAGRRIAALKEHFKVPNGRNSGPILPTMGHTWSSWIRESLGIEPSTARTYMRAYRNPMKEASKRVARGAVKERRKVYLAGVSDEQADVIKRIIKALQGYSVFDLKRLEKDL